MIIELHPKLGFSEEVSHHQSPVRLGDGYSMQSRVKGSDRKSFQITGTLRSLGEMQAVVAQFESLAGVKFQWRPISELGYRDWWCPSWDVTYLGADGQGRKWEMSAKFEEAR